MTLLAPSPLGAPWDQGPQAECGEKSKGAFQICIHVLLSMITCILPKCEDLGHPPIWWWQ